MKRNFVVVIVLVAVAALFLALGQMNYKKAAQSGNAEQEVTKLVREWDEAAIRRDTATLGRLLADDFTMTGVDGRVTDKNQYLLLIFKAPSKVHDDPVKDIKVQLDGDKATVTGRGTAKVQYRNPHVKSEYQFTDVWMKRNGNWQAVSTQISPVGQP